MDLYSACLAFLVFFLGLLITMSGKLRSLHMLLPLVSADKEHLIAQNPKRQP